MMHYPFHEELREEIISRAQQLFNDSMRYTFPDGSFAFDIYLPESAPDDKATSRLARARLIDINPWAPKTDALLFDWRELLELHVPHPVLGTVEQNGQGIDDESTDEEEGNDFTPELRLVAKEDAAAMNFASPQYSAHKLPKEVVDATTSGEGGLREFAEQWQRMIERR